MGQLGIQKVRQKSECSRPRPPTLAATYSGPGAGTRTNTRSTGPQGALLGLTLDSHWERHTYDFVYWLHSGATRRPKKPNPEKSRKALWSLEVFKRRRGQKLKTESDERVEMTSYVLVCEMQLALYDSPLQMLKFKQVPRADQALLPAQVDSFVGCSLHCALHPPLKNNSKEPL